MAVQPIQQDYNFFGYYAPIIQFQRPQITQASTIGWLDYLILPLDNSVDGKAGDVIEVTFGYLAGGPIRSLEHNMRVTLHTAQTGS